MSRKERKAHAFCPYRKCLAPVYGNSPVCERHTAMALHAALQEWRAYVRRHGGRFYGKPTYEVHVDAVCRSIEVYELALESGELSNPKQPTLPGME